MLFLTQKKTRKPLRREEILKTMTTHRLNVHQTQEMLTIVAERRRESYVYKKKNQQIQQSIHDKNMQPVLSRMT